MSKRKSTNSALSFDDVLIDINDWLAEENGENNEIGDNLDKLCGEQEEINPNQNRNLKDRNLKNLKKMYIGNKDTGQENNSLVIETFATLTVH